MDKIKRKISVFYSYAHEDENFVAALEKQLGVLKRTGVITTWHDRQISPGGDWEHEINEHLESAQVIVLMVSADFVNSDYCYEKEMVRAIQLHELQKAVVVPIVLKEVAFLEKTPFGKLQMLPKDAKPIVQWERAEAAWAEVAQALGNVCLELQERVERTEDEAEAQRIYAQIAADAKRFQAERHEIEKNMARMIFNASTAMPKTAKIKTVKAAFNNMDAYINPEGEATGEKDKRT